MIAVIFELVPAEGRQAAYLQTAAALRAQLEAIDGFISVERFESLTQPGKLLSLSFWRDEAAVQQWRNIEAHRAAQAAGREGLFADYRLRVAEVMRDGFLQRFLDLVVDLAAGNAAAALREVRCHLVDVEVDARHLPRSRDDPRRDPGAAIAGAHGAVRRRRVAHHRTRAERVRCQEG